MYKVETKCKAEERRSIKIQWEDHALSKNVSFNTLSISNCKTAE